MKACCSNLTTQSAETKLPNKARSTLLTSCVAHFLHDGLSDVLYVLFPVWNKEFLLTFSQVGLLRTVYSGAMSFFQIPAGIIAERWGETKLLFAGTLLCAIGFCLLQTVHTFPWLVLLLFLTGLGSSVQHPLCSALVSQAYEEGPRRTVLGTYNFTGDLGKMSLPVAITLLITWFGWRSATFCTGATAGVCAIVIYAALRRIDTVVYAPRVSKDSLSGNGWGIRDKRSFTVLSTIHILDSTARTSLLTYLSFVLLAKGAELPTIGIAVGLTLGGGAAGKFFCAVLAQRYGINRTVITTELVTGGGIAALVFLPLGPALILLPVLGMALNGTSSVLYGTVAELVEAKKRGRAYGLFYTLGIGSGALAPSVYGLLCDRVGVQATLLTTAVVVLLIIPLVNLLHLTDTPQQ